MRKVVTMLALSAHRINMGTYDPEITAFGTHDRNLQGVESTCDRIAVTHCPCCSYIVTLVTPVSYAVRDTCVALRQTTLLKPVLFQLGRPVLFPMSSINPRREVLHRYNGPRERVLLYFCD